MASAPRVKAFSREAVPGAPAWMEPLFALLNESAGQAGAALSRSLTFSENFAAELKTVSFTAPYPVWRTGLSGTWVDFGGSDEVHGYRIDESGRVWTKGLVKNGAAAPSTILQVPLGYAPEDRHIFVVPTSGAVKGEVHALGSGVVSLDAGNVGYVSLAGLSWQAGDPSLPDAPTTGGWPLTVKHALPSVGGVLPFACRTEGVTPNMSAGAPTIDWERSTNGSVRIKNVFGLTPGRKYKMDLLLFVR